MTLAEYTNAEFQLNDTSSVISVLDHKTVATAGPAMLSVSAEPMTELTVFVEKIRNKVLEITYSDDDPVFPSWSGKKITVSMVSTQLNNFWKQSTGNELKKNVTATTIRKMAATAVHHNEPTLKNDLANLMNHDVRIAQKSYFLQDKRLRVASTSAELQKVLRKDYEDISPSHLREIFQGESLTLSLVREKMEQFPELNCWNEKQVYDRAKYYVNAKSEGKEQEEELFDGEEMETAEDKNKLDDLDDGLPDSEPESDLGSVSSYGGMKRRRSARYSAFESNVILQLCNSFIRSTDPIRSEDVEEMFLRNKKLKPILKKFSLPSILIKIRTERSKLDKR